MSVTFSAQHTQVTGYRVGCFCGAGQTVADYGQATALLTTQRTTGKPIPGCTDPEGCMACCDGAMITVQTDADDCPSLNVCNDNARALLEALGFVRDDAGDGQVEMCGVADAADFTGRILLAQALSPADKGMPSYAVAPRVYQGSRPAGYLQDRLDDLAAIAAWCVDHATQVSWA